ncbi:MAG: class I SAM-dependent methyltransferase [bacterium]|nr:class I SAM-dependent methyltransferase [bacterium]
MKIEKPGNCPLCGTSSPKSLGRTHTDRGDLYTQYECDACAVQFWWPLKNPGAEWYSSGAGYSERNCDPVWNATWNHRKTLSFLASHRGKVLDVGCGIGNFLSLAQAKGWECAGVDFDPDAIEAARKKTGLATLEATDVVSYAKAQPEKRYDLVTFFDVLEHVDNHNEFIASVQSILKTDGYVAMSMPYRTHALWLMKGDVPPCHLTCWDMASLKRFLEARGFDVVYMRRSSEGVWPIVMKLRFKFGAWVSFGAVSAARRTVGDVVARPGKRPLLVRVVHIFAKIKDGLIFGLPALVIWLVMIPSPSRYVDLFAIARLRNR